MRGAAVSPEVAEQLPILRNMSPDERQQIVGVASLMDAAPGEYVLRQGKQSQNLLVVLEGRCQVEKQTTGPQACLVVLAELGPHDHFGDMSFFHAAPHSASVRALTDLRLLRIERRHYDELIAQGASSAYKLAYNMVSELAHRLRRMDDWVTELMCNQPANRQVSEWANFRDKLFDSWSL